MKRSAAEILREYGPFPGVDRVNGVTFDGQHVWFASGEQAARLRSRERKDACARSMSPRMQERRSTASTCFRSPRIASRRSIRRPAACWRRSRRPAAAVTPGSPGPKARFGWGSIGPARSIKSIPKQGRSFAPSSATASSPGSPGSTASSGTAPGKVTRAICGASIPNGRGTRETRNAAWSRRVGARIRWRRSVLLRRRKQRQGASRSPAEARPSPLTSAELYCSFPVN